jgi:hypothetical protein
MSLIQEINKMVLEAEGKSKKTVGNKSRSAVYHADYLHTTKYKKLKKNRKP